MPQLAVMPIIDKIMPKSDFAAPRRNNRVAALIYDGLCTFEFACAAEIFGLPRSELGVDWYQFESFHTGIVQFALADGSVRGISKNIDANTFRYLGGMGDGEVLGEF